MGGRCFTPSKERRLNTDYSKTVVDPIRQVVPCSTLRGFTEGYGDRDEDVLLPADELHLGRKLGALRFTTTTARNDSHRTIVFYSFASVGLMEVSVEVHVDHVKQRLASNASRLCMPSRHATSPMPKPNRANSIVNRHVSTTPYASPCRTTRLTAQLMLSTPCLIDNYRHRFPVEFSKPAQLNCSVLENVGEMCTCYSMNKNGMSLSITFETKRPSESTVHDTGGLTVKTPRSIQRNRPLRLAQTEVSGLIAKLLPLLVRSCQRITPLEHKTHQYEHRQKRKATTSLPD
ncbi:hypothetical protein EW146_g9966 [Bondarzewia mesenterica]|uniref:Uncharacterized protein n=1 Tax=Bondarzewia mesenterica TaxID=1095465 RepID=A0A4S4L1L8_9AGAM|nr:hypothetical protein EW146_g9966 [Bondarzewia mesenterica]